ncbi:MAG: PAS domain-containing protein [Deltaproteobacteria bacterium]|nr:PAS domain-containing protein [Deltaproteobacteria bacterium]
MIRAHFPWRLFSRIVLIQAVLVLVALTASAVAARYFFKRQFIAQVESQLHVTLDVLARDIPKTSDAAWCDAHSSVGPSENSLRLTIIDDSGKVLCDSRHEAKTMGNHNERPEVVEARSSGFGQSLRLSATLGESMLYGAISLTDRHVVLRGAMPLAQLSRSLRIFDTSLAIFLVVIAAVIGGLAVWAARSLVFPIGRLLLKARSVLSINELLSEEGSGEEPFGELSDLETSLDSIRRDLEAKAERLNLQREEQATLMSAISDSILAVDLEGAPLFYNSRFMVMFGREKDRDRNFRLWEMFRDPEILGAFRTALKEGLSNLVNAIPFEQESGRKFFSISVSPLRRTSGDIYGAVGIFHDVTELKLAEQIRIDFVANVSHELRTPLTAIKGYADTLGHDIDQGRPPEKEFIEIIMRNTSRLMSLINDLLDLSSLESNVEDLQKTLIHTDEFTNRVLNQMKGVFEKKGHSVTIDSQSPTVLADPRRLEQVLVNLLDNAGKYTPAGGKIAVHWDAGAAKTEVLLKVVDSGPGIPTKHHARLFERFYRVDKARSRELGGTGLGLAIVKHIMQRHSGTVWVESTLGQGSTFVCKFPGGE